MKISSECYLCIFSQALKISKRMKLSEQKTSEILRGVGKILSKYDLNVTPPEIAKEVYEFISKISKVKDPYLNEKKEAINEALKFKKILQKRIQKSKNPLFDACRVAVSGNVIDLGVNQEYDLQKEIKNIFELNFKYNDFDKFQSELNNAKSIVYLADNAGENVFDEILIEVLKNYVDTIYYFVRGKPIINDVTKEDLAGLEIEKLAEIIDTGVSTPGFNLKFANKLSKKLFYEADMVISKGMGNFECLYNECKRSVFYLFKVKCEVVAREVKANIGEYVFLKNEI